MKNISFSMTTKQFLNGSKTVTRRLGWRFLAPGDHLMACEKCQGLKKGEEIKRLGKIVVLQVRQETLDCITPGDCRKEGFPGFMPNQFIEMFCKAMRCHEWTVVTRIEFRKLERTAKVNGEK